jgi:hypothetical protein
MLISGGARRRKNELVTVALDLRKKLRAVPASSATNDCRALCEALILKLGRAGYLFPSTPEEAAPGRP